MRRLKVGMVGIGRATAYGRVFSESKRTTVSALCDINSTILESCGREFDLKDGCLFTKYDDFINSDIDIVVLGTPIPFHAEQTVKALQCGKHVLSEVTAADTIDGCIAIFDAARKSKAKYMLAENCNYMHFVFEWKRFIDQDRIGKIHYAEADYVHEIRRLVADKSTGETKWRAGRAPIHYCSHSLGPLLFWMDDHIIKATASGSQATIMKNVGAGAIDMQVALFETKKGAIIKVLRSSVAARHPMLAAYSIYGTRGFLETGRTNYENTGLKFFEDEEDGEDSIVIKIADENSPKEAYLGGHGTSEYYLVKDFLDAVENDTTPPIDAVKGIDMTVPGIVAHEAAMRGNIWLDVPRFV